MHDSTERKRCRPRGLETGLRDRIDRAHINFIAAISNDDGVAHTFERRAQAGGHATAIPQHEPRPRRTERAVSVQRVCSAHPFGRVLQAGGRIDGIFDRRRGQVGVRTNVIEPEAFALPRVGRERHRFGAARIQSRPVNSATSAEQRSDHATKAGVPVTPAVQRMGHDHVTAGGG
jgi:hypothetical protein